VSDELTLDEHMARFPGHYAAHHDTYHGVWRCGWCGGVLDVTRPGAIECRCGHRYQVAHDDGGQVVAVEWMRPKEA